LTLTLTAGSRWLLVVCDAAIGIGVAKGVLGLGPELKDEILSYTQENNCGIQR